MSLLFESIRIENGFAHHIDIHQERINKSLFYLGTNNFLNLQDYISELKFPKTNIHKLRISYNRKKFTKHSITPYKTSKINNVELISHNNINYSLKFEDRTIINQLYDKSSADEIIIIKNGLLTDSSKSNILLYDGNKWHTPLKPLLNGTQRTLLLRNKQIQATAIKVDEINNYTHFCFINALNPFKKESIHSINKIY